MCSELSRGLQQESPHGPVLCHRPRKRPRQRRRLWLQLRCPASAFPPAAEPLQNVFSEDKRHSESWHLCRRRLLRPPTNLISGPISNSPRAAPAPSPQRPGRRTLLLSSKRGSVQGFSAVHTMSPSPITRPPSHELPRLRASGTVGSHLGTSPLQAPTVRVST